MSGSSTFVQFLLLFVAIYSSPHENSVLFNRNSNRAERSVVFLKHPSSFLDVRRVVSRIKVKREQVCGLQCLRNELCYSFNMAAHSDYRGDYDCQLLSTDKYRSYYMFKPSAHYNHYSIANPCEYKPCGDGDSCFPLYTTEGFLCHRGRNFMGKAFPWFKVNDASVCFGAKDNSAGNFTVRVAGSIAALKLEYVSGFVSCNKRSLPYGSHWACKKKYKSIGTLVTNQHNQVVFPEGYQNKGLYLHGYNYNSSELVFTSLSPPLKVSAGQEFRIWYYEDFLNNGKEDDNAGKTCTNVFVLYA